MKTPTLLACGLLTLINLMGCSDAAPPPPSGGSNPVEVSPGPPEDAAGKANLRKAAPKPGI